MNWPDLTDLNWPTWPDLTDLTWPERPNLNWLDLNWTDLTWPIWLDLTWASWPELTRRDLNWPDRLDLIDPNLTWPDRPDLTCPTWPYLTWPDLTRPTWPSLTCSDLTWPDPQVTVTPVSVNVIGFFFYYTYDFFIIPNFCLLYLVLLIPEIVGITKLGITKDFGTCPSISKITVKNKEFKEIFCYTLYFSIIMRGIINILENCQV